MTDVQAAITRGLTASQNIELNRARLRGDLEALFLVAGLAALDLIIAQERQSLAERYAGRITESGFIR